MTRQDVAIWQPRSRDLFVQLDRPGPRPVFEDVEVPEDAWSNAHADAALTAAGWTRTGPWKPRPGITAAQNRHHAAVERTLRWDDVTSDGALVYRRYGTPERWLTAVAEKPDGWHVTAYDYRGRGHGFSARKVGVFPTEDAARDAAEADAAVRAGKDAP